MLTDSEIKKSIAAGEFALEPFEPSSLQPASYDFRVGETAFTSSSREKVNLAQRGVLIVEPGEFAVVEALERVRFGPQIAALLGHADPLEGSSASLQRLSNGVDAVDVVHEVSVYRGSFSRLASSC